MLLAFPSTAGITLHLAETMSKCFVFHFVCAGRRTTITEPTVEVIGQRIEIDSFLMPRTWQGLSLGRKAWWKVLLPAEPSHQHKISRDLIRRESPRAGGDV